MRLIIASLISICLFGLAAHAATVDVLSQATQSWDGTTLAYPDGQAELSVMRITINPADQLDFHCHPVPSAAYVVSGDLEVSLKDGSAKVFKAGDIITEVVGRLHRGINLSETHPIELIVFYASAVGQPITLHGKEPVAGCHE